MDLEKFRVDYFEAVWDFLLPESPLKRLGLEPENFGGLFLRGGFLGFPAPRIPLKCLVLEVKNFAIVTSRLMLVCLCTLGQEQGRLAFPQHMRERCK